MGDALYDNSTCSWMSCREAIGFAAVALGSLALESLCLDMFSLGVVAL